MSGSYIQVFGGLQVWQDEVTVGSGSPQQQLLLAALVAAGGHAVAVEDLVTALWEQDPPASAVNQVHRLVGRLRRVLEPGLPTRAPGEWVRAAGAGYRLTMEPETCDLARFRVLVARARVTAGSEAVRNWVQALRLAGPAAFVGLPPRVLERPEFVGIQQERRSAAAEAAEAALVAGRTVDILDSVLVLAGEAPWDERLQAAAIRLLAAAGHRAGALTRYDDVRRRLAADLGIDPGPELSAAHREVLAETGTAPPAPAPNQLPAPIRVFTDREGGLAALDEQLGDDLSGTVVVTAVAGMAGVGKTALAVQWAHSVADRFPDGQLFVNLRGFDPAGRTVPAAKALAGLCAALDVPLGDLPEDDLDGRSARFRSALTGRKVLLLLDNARDAEHVRPLLPGTPGCLALVTSRNRLSSLVVRESARTVPLGRLSPSDGIHLLADRLGRHRVDAEPVAAAAIVAACGGLPLALAIAAARAATNPALSLTGIAAELASTELDALATDDGLENVRAAFALSYTALSPGAARLFRLLAAHPGPEVSFAAAASLAGVTTEVARRLLAELLTASMLGETSPGRYTVHDLLHLYAVELLDAEGERAAAERRLVHHYAAAVRAAYLVYGRPPVGDLEPTDDHLAVERLPDIAGTWRWFAVERPTLIAVVHLAVAHGLDRCAATIALDWRPMSQSFMDHHELEPHVLAALEAARRTGDLRLQGDLERDMASICEKLDRPGDAERSGRHSARALAVFRELDDPAGEANVLRNRAQAMLQRGHYDTAEELGRRALEIGRRTGRLDVISICLYEVGIALLRRHRPAPAAELLSEALAIVRADGLAYLEFDIAANLADCMLELDRPKEALDLVDEVLLVSGDFAALEPEARVAIAATSAVAAYRCGDTARAATSCLEFAEWRTRAGYPAHPPPGYQNLVLPIQEQMLELAATLGLTLDFPRVP